MSRTRMLILPAVLILGLGLTACGGGKSNSASSSAPASTSASASASASGSTSAPAASSAVSSPPVKTPEPAPAPSDSSTPDSSGIDPQAVENGDLSKDQYGDTPIGQAVTVEGGVAVSLGQSWAEDLASAPGEVGGPGIIVPIVLTNNSGEEISLGGFSATLSYGDGDGTPAGEITSASAQAPASLAAGKTVSIERAFVVPADARGNVKVVVDLGADYHAAVFRGSVG